MRDITPHALNTPLKKKVLTKVGEQVQYLK